MNKQIISTGVDSRNRKMREHSDGGGGELGPLPGVFETPAISVFVRGGAYEYV